MFSPAFSARGVVRRSALSWTGVVAQQRGYLETSQIKSHQKPAQWVVPKSVAGGKFRHAMRSPYGIRAPKEQPKVAVDDSEEQVNWDDASSADVLAGKKNAAEAEKVQRPYVPLGDLAKIEVRGDYLTEAGKGQEALEHYGVVMAGYEAAYPAHHNQIAKMRIKLARALRMSARHESAVASCKAALEALEGVDLPQVEHIVEALLEAGEAEMAQGRPADAGAIFEDCLRILDGHHDLGASHRHLRQHKLIARRLHLNSASKFTYYSPYVYDRVYAIVDTALLRAEQAFDQAGDAEGSVRVLEARVQLTDRKFFNMRDYAFKVRTARGRNMTKGKAYSARPSATEVLAFSPTVHRPYFDYSALSTAPLGHEDEVAVGANAKMLDDGDPTRFIHAKKLRKAARDASAADFIKKHWAGTAKQEGE